MKGSAAGAPRAVHTWFLAAAPALLLYAENAAQLTPSQLVLPLLASFALTAALLAAVRVAAGDPASAAALSSAVLAAFWSRGHLSTAMTGWVGSDATRVATGLLTVLLLVGLALRLRSRPPSAATTRFLNVGAAALLALPLARVLLTAKPSRPSAGPTEAGVRLPGATAGKRLPDVYLVLLDAYGSPRVLSQRYGLDLTPS